MNDKRLKIAYITPLDARDKHSWSGTEYSIWKALEKWVGDVELIGPVRPFFPLWIGKMTTGFCQKILHKRYNYRHSRILAKAYGRIVNRKLKKTSYDLLVIAPTSTLMSFLKTAVPVAYVGDSTVAGSLNYHEALSRLLSCSIKETIAVEGMAFEKADFLLFSSEWAAKSAVSGYHINPSKVFVAPFGPNMDSLPSRQLALAKQRTKQCRLFFIGVSWVNKGGSIAYNAMVELNKMGIDTQLTVCGCIPPKEFNHPNLHIIPFLNKHDKEQRKMLDDIYLHTDFLILPTRFEAFGVVFSEASAFGVPSITADTGGVSSAVAEGKNGFLLPLSATGKDYAQLIARIFQDTEKYDSLCKESRNLFETTLNWDRWAQSFIGAWQKTSLKFQ